MLEKTLIIVKPHAVTRGLVGKILQRFEDMDLKFMELKIIKGSQELWESFYPSNERWLENVGNKILENYKTNNLDVNGKFGTSDPISIGRIVKSWLVKHMSSSNSVAVIFKGNEVLNKARIACGDTLPNLAAPGTIRFDFSSDSPIVASDEQRPVFNLIHVSNPEEMRDGQRAVDYEISILFPELGG
ncbi:MAG: nucleoside-diphosphate kinase [Patescibacteria group bacterium]|nr:nucleoside-diphosphate kinase [Patescibacteria group bacterium]